MGTLYEFKCPECGYSAEVSGDDDVGMGAVTTTIACKTCKKLLDVVISEEPWLVTLGEPGLSWDPDFQPKIQCKKSARHNLQRWTFPGACPKCGTMMERGEMTARWDRQKSRSICTQALGYYPVPPVHGCPYPRAGNRGHSPSGRPYSFFWKKSASCL